jgi:pimeloyl-ACP methyl ester carboxylesterase
MGSCRTSRAAFERLASFSRVILFDKRGTGMSDPVAEHELPSLEQRMDDVRAVMDAVGSARAAIFGASEGGNMSMLFAASYPERTVALATFGCTGRSESGATTTRGRRPGRRASGRSHTSSRTGGLASAGRRWRPVLDSVQLAEPRAATTGGARVPAPQSR